MKQRNSIKVSDPVKIRFRNTANGGQSIFLDYVVKGKRKFEFLKLYLLPGSSKEIKEQNNATMMIVQAKKSQRVLDLQDETRDRTLAASTTLQGKRVGDFINHLIESDIIAEKTKKAYRNLLRFVNDFYGEKLTFRKVDKQFVKDFIKRLQSYKCPHAYGSKSAKESMSNNSIIAVYSVLRSILAKAYDEGVLAENPACAVPISEYVKSLDKERVFLEMDELQRFADTETEYEEEKRAFVFSCLCGLRISDIRALKWGDIKKVGGDYKISIRQIKTKKLLSLPLSPEALNWLPDNNGAKATDFVFHLIAQQYINDRVRKIAEKAGIRKHITFHSARHTHATLLLTLGTDIYTVSKLLGHRRVSTTEIYAAVVDDKKREAIGLIPNFLEED